MSIIKSLVNLNSLGSGEWEIQVNAASSICGARKKVHCEPTHKPTKGREDYWAILEAMWGLSKVEMWSFCLILINNQSVTEGLSLLHMRSAALGGLDSWSSEST